MSRSMSTPFSSYQMRLISLLQKLYNFRARLQPVVLPELLKQVESARTSTALRKAVNTIQTRLWQLPKAEQTAPREQLLCALQYHTLHGQQMSLRIEAAQWLRLYIQTRLTTRPQEVFVTLITATIQVSNASEQTTYLKLIFDCFWPFRYPHPVYSWKQFPANSVFFPLATLLPNVEHKLQEALLVIFAELPTLNEPEITTPLRPVALHWAKHNNPECRRLIAPVLARMQHVEAQATLQKLLSDTDAIVRASARNASSYTCQ